MLKHSTHAGWCTCSEHSLHVELESLLALHVSVDTKGTQRCGHTSSTDLAAGDYSQRKYSGGTNRVSSVTVTPIRQTNKLLGSQGNFHLCSK